MHQQHVGSPCDQRYRREGLDRVVLQPGLKGRAEGEAGRGGEQGVTIRRGLGDEGETDLVVAAGLVLDDEIHLQGFAQFGGENARLDVGAAAWRLETMTCTVPDRQAATMPRLIAEWFSFMIPPFGMNGIAVCQPVALRDAHKPMCGRQRFTWGSLCVNAGAADIHRQAMLLCKDGQVS